jgi:hypothetical protein
VEIKNERSSSLGREKLIIYSVIQLSNVENTSIVLAVSPEITLARSAELVGKSERMVKNTHRELASA